NIFECWSEGTATFMINGERCTRACGFCLVDTRQPGPLDADEPDHVAEAVVRMGLRHAVVTAVARDDLPDGGAAAFAATIRAIRRRSPLTRDEVRAALADLRAVGTDIVTIGQYLRPTENHLPVARWWTPEEFAYLAREGEALGIGHVESSPLTRSSYHAGHAADVAIRTAETG